VGFDQKDKWGAQTLAVREDDGSSVGQWYSIRRAIAWIDVQRPPVQWNDEGFLAYENRLYIMARDVTKVCSDSWDILFNLFCLGKVELQGKAAINIKGITDCTDCWKVYCDGGEPSKRIPPEKIKEIGPTGFLNDCAMLVEGAPPYPKAAYSSLIVNFRDLLREYPPLSFGRW